MMVRLLSACAAVTMAAGAEVPRIGILEIYGVRKTPIEKVRQALGVKEGDPLPSSKGDIEERLAAIPGVVQADLEAVCCEDGKAILYAGIEEKGAPRFEINSPPTGHVHLPEEIHAAYASFLAAAGKAARRGETREDLTAGHSLMADAEARACQERFLELANEHFALLRKVLRESEDAEHRAIAAYVAGYAKDKNAAANDLQYAMRDPDAVVRGNAIRALGAMIVLAEKDPDSGIRVQPTWFIEMLNSIYWSDRNNAAVALVNFTEKREPGVLEQLRERAMPSLVEMARFRHLPHALPAVILLGRIGGLPESEIQDLWNQGKRDELIERVKALAARK